MCMCMCMCVHAYACACMHVHMHAYMCICMCMYACAYGVHTPASSSPEGSMHMCICMYACACMHVCMCIRCAHLQAARPRAASRTASLPATPARHCRTWRESRSSSGAPACIWSMWRMHMYACRTWRDSRSSSGAPDGTTPPSMLTYLLTYLPTYLLTYLPTYLLTYLLTHLPTYLPDGTTPPSMRSGGRGAAGASSSNADVRPPRTAPNSSPSPAGV